MKMNYLYKTLSLFSFILVIFGFAHVANATSYWTSPVITVGQCNTTYSIYNAGGCYANKDCGFYYDNNTTVNKPDLWSRYNVEKTTTIKFEPVPGFDPTSSVCDSTELCFSQTVFDFFRLSNIYSTADKYAPAGFDNTKLYLMIDRSGCTSPAVDTTPYKVCCELNPAGLTTGKAVPALSIDADDLPPPEGQCPSGSKIYENVNSNPAYLAENNYGYSADLTCPKPTQCTEDKKCTGTTYTSCVNGVYVDNLNDSRCAPILCAAGCNGATTYTSCPNGPLGKPAYSPNDSRCVPTQPTPPPSTGGGGVPPGGILCQFGVCFCSDGQLHFGSCPAPTPPPSSGPCVFGVCFCSDGQLHFGSCAPTQPSSSSPTPPVTPPSQNISSTFLQPVSCTPQGTYIENKCQVGCVFDPQTKECDEDTHACTSTGSNRCVTATGADCGAPKAVTHTCNTSWFQPCPSNPFTFSSCRLNCGPFGCEGNCNTMDCLPKVCHARTGDEATCGSYSPSGNLCGVNQTRTCQRTDTSSCTDTRTQCDCNIQCKAEWTEGTVECEWGQGCAPGPSNTYNGIDGCGNKIFTDSCKGPQTPPSCNLTSSSTQALVNQKVNLNWSCALADTCSIDNGIGSVPTSGSKQVASSTTKTYKLTCTNAKGPTSQSTTINIFAPSIQEKNPSFIDSILKILSFSITKNKIAGF